MKEEAMKRIHTIGHIGVIISNIYSVLIICLMLVVLAVGIRLLTVPKNLLTIQIDTSVSVLVDSNSISDDTSGTTIDNYLNSLYSLIKNENVYLVNQDGSVIPISASALDQDQDKDAALLNITSTAPQTQRLTLSNLAWLFFAILLYLGMSLVTACFIKKLCTAVRFCDSPFDAKVIRKMTSFAFSLIPWVFLSSIMNSVSNSIMYGNQNINISVNVNMIITILVIFALTRIFKYGAVLQQESDETL